MEKQPKGYRNSTSLTMIIKAPVNKITVQLTIIILLYLILIIPLMNNALWHDEIYNTSLYLHTFPAIGFHAKEPAPQAYGWSTDWQRQIALHPPFLSLFYYAWIRAFGDSEISMHIPVAIAGLLGIIILYFLGLAVFDNDVGFMATLATTFSSSHIIYSVQAVHAIFEMLIFLASLLCLTQFIIRKTARLFKLLLLLNMLGIFIFYYYFFYLIVQTIVLLILKKDLKIPPPYFVMVSLLLAVFFVFVKFNYAHNRYSYTHWPKNNLNQTKYNMVYLSRDFTR